MGIEFERPIQSHQDSGGSPADKRIAYLSQTGSNLGLTTELFDPRGLPTPRFEELLLALPLVDKASGRHLISSLKESGQLTHHKVEEVLQSSFFRPNEAKFSFEVAQDGAPPSTEQRDLFERFGLVSEIRVPPLPYDVGVVFGGLVQAIDSRTRFLLDQQAELGSIALLGGQRKLFSNDKESGEVLRATLGDGYYAELERSGALPRTEAEAMSCVWEAHCRRSPSLRSIPVILIDSVLRIGKVKEAPGTPETVVDLVNTLTGGTAIQGRTSAPSTFLLASSQPYALRQREDFLASMAMLGYPGLQQVDVIGFAASGTPALKLYGTEIAKLVHAQYLARYGALAA